MSRKVSVIGQVNHPGQFFLEKTSNIIDLLAMAGGVSQTGGDKAIIIRQVDGHEQKTSIDLYNILQVQQSNAPTITDGDIIFVPEADKFYIHGQVLKPGILKLEHNMTVLQAISAAGGVTPKGSENSVQLKRPDAQGNMQSINVELGELVHPNDIIYIPEGWF
jgi:polysaccharide export outer membrane protein